ncbi:MAG: GTPase Era [Pseudomonadota bacterium]
MNTQSGFIAVVGRPNVGKSTMINAIMGRKVSIVTHKPQTTRHRILAIHNDGDTQMIFIDTPGLHRRAGKAMNRLMNRTATAALADADVVLFVCDAGVWTDEDEDVLARLRDVTVPVIVALNKIDKIHPREALFETLTTMQSRREFAEMIPMSALKGDNVRALLDVLPQYLPESPHLFPQDMHTDRSPEFRAAEVVREKLTEMLHQEIPYGLTVQIEQYRREEDRYLIHAVIWVERDSQKGIVVGKGGRVLKTVGQSARLDLKAELGCPVHLELWVKVKDNWSDSEQDLLQLGYESP